MQGTADRASARCAVRRVGPSRSANRRSAEVRILASRLAVAPDRRQRLRQLGRRLGDRRYRPPVAVGCRGKMRSGRDGLLSTRTPRARYPSSHRRLLHADRLVTVPRRDRRADGIHLRIRWCRMRRRAIHGARGCGCDSVGRMAHSGRSESATSPASTILVPSWVSFRGCLEAQWARGPPDLI
jgi:hypothetical protein